MSDKFSLPIIGHHFADIVEEFELDVPEMSELFQFMVDEDMPCLKLTVKMYQEAMRDA